MRPTISENTVYFLSTSLECFNASYVNAQAQNKYLRKIGVVFHVSVRAQCMMWHDIAM